MKTLTILLMLLWLTGCASQVPLDIRTAPPLDFLPSAVANQPDAFKNQPVRWGGRILTVVNHDKDTEIEMLAQVLDRWGKPVGGDESLGRFLARVQGFIDPAVYAQGRALTVSGWVDSVVTRQIGEKPYVYPVIRIKTLFLWPHQARYAYPAYDPYGYYFPYSRYPYGFRYGLGFGFGRRW